MKRALLIFFLLCTSVVAQDPFARTNPNDEVKDAILHLQEVPAYDREYIRFFTTYAVPEPLREKTVLVLSYLLHSMVGRQSDELGNAGAYYPLAIKTEDEVEYFRKVKGSDTLHWIDLREYNWTPESWERVSQFDPYFVEPIIDSRTNGLLRLLSGNAIFRADWFIVHATNTALQLDRGANFTIYETLLYGNKKFENVDEWRRHWTLDAKKARKIGNSHATLVTKSKEVARHNRILFGYRTEFGWLYETYDVTHQEGLRDYVESFFNWKGGPPIADGGELFAANSLQMQVYALKDGNDKIVNIADGALVRHLNDNVDDARVKVATSCFDCHAAGPLPSENTTREYIESFGQLNIYDKRDKLKIERVYLSGRFKDSIEDSQRLFARSLLKINGLTPEENGAAYLELVKWYRRPLTLDQCAFECGLSAGEFTKKIEEGYVHKNRVPGRVALLLSKKESIPRDVWDSPGKDGIPGTYQQSMLIVYNLVPKKITYYVDEPTNIMSGTDIVGTLKANEQFELVGKETDSYIMIRTSTNIRGWISKDKLKEG